MLYVEIPISQILQAAKTEWKSSLPLDFRIIKFTALSFQFSWLLFNFLFFCKIFKWYNTEPEYHYLRKLLGATLCISRGTVPIINMTLVLVMLPVNRTINQLVHKILGKFSVKYLCFYLEKVKVFHMTLSIGLVMIAGIFL